MQALLAEAKVQIMTEVGWTDPASGGEALKPAPTVRCRHPKPHVGPSSPWGRSVFFAKAPAMTDALSRLLDTRDWLLTDGATGTNLFNMGLTAGDAPEMWNVEHPQRIRVLYQGWVDAGSDLFLTNSFGGNASRLKLHGAEGRVRELNRAAAEIGREVADQAGRTVVVAGSVGPTGEIMAPMGTLTHETAVEMFHEQAEGLKEGGADVLWVETISAAEEFRAAAEASRWRDAVVRDHELRHRGRTMMGLTSPRWSRWWASSPTSRSPFGRELRGGRVGPAADGAGLSPRRAGAADHRQGQRGHPALPRGHIHYDGTPELMADYAGARTGCRARRSSAAAAGPMPEHLSGCASSRRRGREATAGAGVIAERLGASPRPRRHGRRRLRRARGARGRG
jgi:5-methyltetrahydrofolate--homocysteine methyltransferase